jgi:uncharacterized sporulation protein YeaH/YhbH (DUF444 family)
MRKVALPLLSVLIISFLASMKPMGKSARSYYQLTVYHFKGDSQEKVLDAYLKDALLPALRRQNIKQIGVFKAHANDTATNKVLYVLTPIKSLDKLITISNKLKADKLYQDAGSEYLNAVYNQPPYTRMETIYLQVNISQLNK